MFRKLQSKTKRALAKAGALFEATVEVIGDIVDEIDVPDFD